VRKLTAITMLFATLLAAGCATGPGTNAGKTYAVTTPKALFYRYGPAQASGPDFALSLGERVTMLSYEYGYSQVTIPENNMTGWVPTNDITPAAPLPKTSPAPLLASRSRHHYDEEIPPGEQPNAPLPEFPESRPPPGSPPFRY
jgi:hypothetical protein